MTGVAIALAVAAGLAGAVQAAVMGELGGRVGVFPALAFSGVVAVVIGIALLLAAKQSFRGLGDVARQPVWLWSGGALSVLIILAITVASPRSSTASAGSASIRSRSRGRVRSGSSYWVPVQRSRCSSAADFSRPARLRRRQVSDTLTEM